MNRIEEKFAQLKKSSGKAFISYITAGDPNLERTEQLVLALERAGTDIVELGIPFSDPLADGKTNQEAAERALKNNVTLKQVINLVSNLRQKTQIPIIFFTYINPVYQYGYENFAKDAASAGVDGVLALDMPPEEVSPLKKELDKTGVHSIFLIAPTSTEERIKKITAQANGFIYYVSRTGVTGEQKSMSDDIEEHINLIKKHSKLPIAVGFGVSNPEHVCEISKFADGVVVGSAIVRRIGEGGNSDDMIQNIEKFVEELTNPLKNGILD